VVKGVKVNETIKDELLGALRGTRAPPSAFSDGGLMADDIFRRDEPSLKENLMAESPPPSGFPDGGRRRADDEEPPYRVLGSAPGERCIGCGSGRDVKRIDYGGAVDPWHEDCVRGRLEAVANPPVTDPDAVVVSVPFLITRETKRRLRAIGYSDAQIADLTPQQALEILAEKDGQST
jgi:hypothetical protein